ncbi:MAG: hypothetical protein ONB48_17600 [candidate division KSB1 bacterium]|nr:hypothetical protein [candidate division KSB1 bacterium]MDZ7275291.1 hypothetical protein [candidate division KSB1 bacterium]MDZ7287459.1 hypothetical protein [candidate division KSB1 bacterium]MDZ7299573.1 hypothetical protein [candidate division KSB1 bacterium]MDZ7307325.1 hypothetical protein [candidate division KSB1 bacterium]
MDFALTGDSVLENLRFMAVLIVPLVLGLALSLRLRGAFFLGERLLLAMVFGLVAFTKATFLVALVLGVRSAVVLGVQTVMLLTAVLLLAHRRKPATGRKRIAPALPAKRLSKVDRVGLAVFAGSLILFWILAARLILWQNGGLATGYLDAWGDLPLHLSMITVFLNAGPLPLRSSILAGEPLTYPFLADFFSAALMRLGMPLEQAVELPAAWLNSVMLTLLYYLGYRLVRHRGAAALAVGLLLLAGGLGFLWFLSDLFYAPKPIWEFLQHLPRRYTNISALNIHWVNPVLAHLLPQRSFLFGFPMGLAVILLWWQAAGRRPQMAMAAGVLTGLLPLFHTHTFLTAMLLAAMFAGLAVLQRRWQHVKYWLQFTATALLIAAPALWFLLSSQVSRQIIRWHPGWMAEGENWLWFWLKNTSVFIPVLLAALLAARGLRVRRRALAFYLPFGLLFMVGNLFLFSVFAYDTNKVLIFWFLLSLPLVARVLMALWQAKSWWLHGFVFRTLLLALTLSGALNLAHEFQNNGWLELSAEEVQLAQQLRLRTKPEAVFLTAPIHNHLLTLAGRAVVLGYPGHVMSHGLPVSAAQQKVAALYRGDSTAESTLLSAGVDYIVCGPNEHHRYGEVCKRLDRRFPLVAQTENYRVYQVTPAGAAMSALFDAQKGHRGSWPAALPLRTNGEDGK